MIIDAYTATITHNSVDVRVISDSKEIITMVMDPAFEQRIDNSIHAHHLFFYKYTFSSLKSDTDYAVSISQEKNQHRTIRFRTLKIPESKKICRFGILTDLHIAHNYINRPDSGKRLYGKALELAEKYVLRLAEQGAEFIIFPGDTLDPASDENIRIFERLRNISKIPFYPVLGNHEGWGNGNEKMFNTKFCFNINGFYGFSKENTRFLMLSTPEQSSLFSSTAQYSWLLKELEEYNYRHNILMFLHFSFILHPCVRGYKNDGMQQLYNSRELLHLFQKYKGIKAVFAGHKNVPSKVIVHGIAHILSPQLIQAPCGYDIVDIFETGLVCTVYEIDEQDYLWQSRKAFGPGWQERYGSEKSRNFTLLFS